MQQYFVLIMIIAPTAWISYQSFQNRENFDKFKFNAFAIQDQKQWYRFFSHALIHADWMHLIFNMYVLWEFGRLVLTFFQYHFENLANLYFIALYIPAIGFSSISSFIRNRHNPAYNAVGASGAVSAVVFASIVMYPQGQMGFLFIPFMLPSWIFGALYLIYTIVMSRKNMDNIGHDAHLWGAIYGIAFTLIFVPKAFFNFYHYIFS